MAGGFVSTSVAKARDARDKRLRYPQKARALTICPQSPLLLRTLFALACSCVLVAAPQPTRAQGIVSEVKIGGLYHDPGDLWSGFRLERPTTVLNTEVVFSPHVRFLGGVVRPALGATFNFIGGTSKAYIDARWELETASGIFIALGVGAAIHDGAVGPTDPIRKALGSRVLFHFPAELGWRWDDHNSVSVYFEHVSNGYTQDVNEGLDAIGVRYGYRF